MTRTVARKKRVRQKPNNMPWLIGGGVAAVLVVAVLVWINMSFAQNTTPAPVAEGKIWGSANAPVTIEIWSDFQ